MSKVIPAVLELVPSAETGDPTRRKYESRGLEWDEIFTTKAKKNKKWKDKTEANHSSSLDPKFWHVWIK